MKEDLYEIKTTLNNGFTFVLDFASDSEEKARKMDAWAQHYRSLGIQTVIKSVPSESTDVLEAYNLKAISLYGVPFDELDIDSKGGVIELYTEDLLNRF